MVEKQQISKNQAEKKQKLETSESPSSAAKIEQRAANSRTAKTEQKLAKILVEQDVINGSS